MELPLNNRVNLVDWTAGNYLSGLRKYCTCVTIAPLALGSLAPKTLYQKVRRFDLIGRQTAACYAHLVCLTLTNRLALCALPSAVTDVATLFKTVLDHVFSRLIAYITYNTIVQKCCISLGSSQKYEYPQLIYTSHRSGSLIVEVSTSLPSVPLKRDRGLRSGKDTTFPSLYSAGPLRNLIRIY